MITTPPWFTKKKKKMKSHPREKQCLLKLSEIVKTITTYNT